jgi:Pyridoxamine 5'-phosphate oxidase
VADSLAYPARQMTATEFVEFWSSVRLVAMGTVGDKGQPHLAPVHAQIAGTSLKLVIYDNTVRRADLARNPRVGFTTWNDQGAAVIIYGRAREVPNSIRDARAGQSGKPRRVIGIEVAISRIYAMRAPQRSS